MAVPAGMACGTVNVTVSVFGSAVTRAGCVRFPAVMVTSHLGRPTEGAFKPEDSLAPVAQRLAELLGREVPLKSDWVDGVAVQLDTTKRYIMLNKPTGVVSSMADENGRPDLREFTRDYESEIIARLEAWQRFDGFVGFRWIDGLIGRWNVAPRCQ